MSTPERPNQGESETPRASGGSKGRFSFLSGRIRVIGVAIVSVLAVVRIALPFAIEWSVPRIALDHNLYVEIGNVDLGLIVGEVTVEDLIVDFPPSGDGVASPPNDASGEGPEPLLSLDRVYVAYEWTDLLFRRIHITDLELDHPIVSLSELPGGGLDLPFIGAAEEGEPTEPAPAVEDSDEVAVQTEAGWAFILDRFVLKNPDVALHSEAQQEVVRLAADLLGFDALSVDRDGSGLGGLDLEHPVLSVEREWLLGIGREMDSPAPPASTVDSPKESEAAAAELPSLRMKHLKMERAAFTVTTAEGPVEVALRLELSDAGTQAGHTFPVDLGLEIEQAEIGLNGQMGLNPTSFEGRFTWQRLSVPPFLLLAYPKLVPWLASCDAHGDIEIAFSSVDGDEPAGLKVSGSSSTRTLSFRHPETGELALEWDALEIEIHEATLPLEPTADSPIQVNLSRVALVSPNIVYTNPPDALNELMEALGNRSETEAPAAIERGESVEDTPPAAPAEPNSPPRVSIEKLELSDGTLRYVDRSVKPTHETEIRKLRVELGNVTATPIAGAKTLSVDGLIQSTGSFALRGGLPGGHGDLHFELKNLDLVSYDSLARAAGWQVASGESSIESDIVSSSDGYATKNELVLHDLDVVPEDGSAFASQFGMSVEVVLALLRDPSGDIPLSIPVSFDEEGAGVEVGPILASAMRNALTGAIASPINMLGMLVPTGAEADSIGALIFAPGEDELRFDVEPQIEVLAEFIKSRPTLGLSLDGHWSEADRRRTAERLLEEAATSGGKLPEVDGVGLLARRRIRAALRARSGGEEGPLSSEDEALLERIVAAQAVSDERFQSLARARAQALRQAMIERDTPSEALSLGPVTNAEEPSVSLDLGTRAELSPPPGA